MENNGYIIGYKETKIGKIPIVSTALTLHDKAGALRVRFNFGRMNYNVNPGLYCTGDPGADSEVFVTANYKLSFDMLRRELNGMNAWILVLDTKGINVWCAAGKGTFGTEELAGRIIGSKIRQLVGHKRIILPQLGAVGVEAHTVKKITGMIVIYGPVYARDIRNFIGNNYMKNPEMKQVNFNFRDRLVLVPVEVAGSLILAAAVSLLGAVFGFFENWKLGFNILYGVIPYLGAVLAGTIAVPLMLPVIPSRSFAIKGLLAGIVWSLIVSSILHANAAGFIVNMLVLPPISSFLALNFTGATTFTSLKGVRFEIKFALPLFALSVLLGITAKILNIFKII